MDYKVKTFRSVGLEAMWSRTQAGTPVIFVRNPASNLNHQRKQWWMVGNKMWEDMKKEGVVEAFTSHTLLGDIFSIPA